MDRVDEFTLAADAVTLVVRDGRRLRAIAANRKPEPERDRAAASEPPSRNSGWLDLDRIRVSVEPRREWRQMLREVWRLQRDQFWVPDMSGIDWEAIYRHYEPLLESRRDPRRALGPDLEMQGELGTSHAYEMGGDYRRPPQVPLGYLAAEVRLAGKDGSYEIARIVTGDPWEPGADSPLNAVGVEAKPGERIVAVNGQKTRADRPPQSLLVHQAGARVELSLAHATGKSRFDARRAGDHTLRRSPGTLSRVGRAQSRVGARDVAGARRLPAPADMMSAGFAEFHRYFSAECDREALIVDVRYNRGGHVSQLLLEKVARKRIGYNLFALVAGAAYPTRRWPGPWSRSPTSTPVPTATSSPHAFKLMQIGPLVGTRTWGGVIGIWPRHRLVDGTETTQPESRSGSRTWAGVSRTTDRPDGRGGQRAAGCRDGPRPAA